MPHDCPRPDCEESFANMDQLHDHLNFDHEGEFEKLVRGELYDD